MRAFCCISVTSQKSSSESEMSPGRRSRVVTIAGESPSRPIRPIGPTEEWTAMNHETSQEMTTGMLTWERVVDGALKQAARHERALRACLAELGGYDAPTSDLADSTRLRAI